MAAPEGNQYWKLRSKHGANRKFTNPEDLWEKACEYFQWVEDNPLLEEKAFAYEGVISKDSITKMRAMTIDGLTFYLGITHETWLAWRKRKDLSLVVSEIDRVIRDQKFSGAAAGLLNSNIIARDLGLRERTETDLKAPEGISLVLNYGSKAGD